MKKLLVLLFATMPFVAFADGKSPILYIVYPPIVHTIAVASLAEMEFPVDVWVNTDNNYNLGLKIKSYTKIDCLDIGDIVTINGRKLKIEECKNYYFAVGKNNGFIKESDGSRMCNTYKYIAPNHFENIVMTTNNTSTINTGYQKIEPTQNTTVPASDVDMNIPETGVKSENTFALIIANENYMFVDDVRFALNDGEIFREYCIKTLGIPERQVWFYKNASAGIISGGVDKLLQVMDIFDSPKIIVYYCGHGIPDDKTGDAYIVPTDGKGTNVATCYSLNKLYTTLSSSKASSVTYFMDACFTGANRDGSMLVAARGVAREAKKEVIKGNTVVFSAASGDETAMPFAEKSHGLFTYYLLKKLQETKGNVSYGELAEYIGTNVKREAFLTNEKPQTPVVATSETNMKNWKTMNVR